MRLTACSFAVAAVVLFAGCASDPAFWSGVAAGLSNANAPVTSAPQLLIFGGQGHDVFLGCLNCSEYSSSSVLNQYGNFGSTYSKAIAVQSKIPFDDFLIDHFIGCKIGDRDLFYDRKRRRLFWRNFAGEIVVVPFLAKHKFDLNVKPPWYNDPHLPRPNLELKPNEIHMHRMSASPHEILGVNMSATNAELKKAKHYIAQLYHPDRAASLDEQLRAAMNRRMAEANAAFDELVGKNRRRR